MDKKNFNIFALNLIYTNMAILKSETTQTTTNPDTGQVITETTSKTFKVRTTSEEFYFTFLTLIKNIVGLKSIVDVKVLYALCNLAEFNTGIVSLSTNKRNEILSFLDITYHTLSNSLTRLKKNGFIVVNKGDITINPQYFWKGDLKTRENLLRENNLSFNVEFVNE